MKDDRDSLLEELAQARAREHATRNILDVISRSRDDEKPVFDAILENACTLCNAPLAGLILGSPDDSVQRLAAHRGMFSSAVDLFESGQMRMDRDLSYAARSIIDGKLVAFEDMGTSELYNAGSPIVRSMVDASNIRSVLFVPLILHGRAIGNLTLFRREINPFNGDEISLAETFASQAVIAIENVRQFREVRARLDREAATREILQVISQSPNDDRPVFDAILKRAAKLCHATAVGLVLLNKEDNALDFTHSIGRPILSFKPGETRWPADGTQAVAQAVQTGRTIHEEDFANSPLYREGDPTRRRLVDEAGIRSVVAVPLMQGTSAIGAIAAHRHDNAPPFETSAIELIETFASQAVIAIENVRQFRELEKLNAELGDRVQAQVGELERMGRLKRFLPEQVADAVVSSGDDSMLSSHRALIAALFCDIRGFTAFCETAEPEETIEVLQTYHEQMGELISVFGAGVDHRAGDGIMVLFNDPLPCDNPAGQAVRLAFAMRDRMADLCARWRKMGHRLGFGVGVSLGYATVGMVGSEGRYHYTASGTAVNLAARLCDMAQDGEILLSPRAAAAVEEDTALESVGEVQIKGISAPVEVIRALS